MAKKKMTYKEALSELEEIRNKFESLEGELSLEDIKKQVARAKELIAFCRNELRTTKDMVDKELEEF